MRNWFVELILLSPHERHMSSHLNEVLTTVSVRANIVIFFIFISLSYFQVSTVVFMRANLVIFIFVSFFLGVNNSLRDHGSRPFFCHHRPKLSDLPCGDHHHHHHHYRYCCYYHHLPNHHCTILFDLLCSEVLALFHIELILQIC